MSSVWCLEPVATLLCSSLQVELGEVLELESLLDILGVVVSLLLLVGGADSCVLGRWLRSSIELASLITDSRVLLYTKFTHQSIQSEHTSCRQLNQT